MIAISLFFIFVDFNNGVRYGYYESYYNNTLIDISDELKKGNVDTVIKSIDDSMKERYNPNVSIPNQISGKLNTKK